MKAPVIKTNVIEGAWPIKLIRRNMGAGLKISIRGMVLFQASAGKWESSQAAMRLPAALLPDGYVFVLEKDKRLGLTIDDTLIDHYLGNIIQRR